jgi:hypothetical protein
VGNIGDELEVEGDEAAEDLPVLRERTLNVETTRRRAL